MDNSLLSAHLSWQGGIVLGLLFSSILLSRITKAFPEDLIFTFAALFHAFFGIVSSTELYQASVNQFILAVLGLWIIGKAFDLLRPFSLKKTFREQFPLPLLLEIFSAAIFFFAMRNSGLSQWCASSIYGASPFIFLPLFFFIGHIAAHFMPRPIAFAMLFSIAFSLCATQSTQLFCLGTNIGIATAAPLLSAAKTPHPISQGGKSLLGLRVALVVGLFAMIVIPSCLFWPFQRI